MVANGSPTVKVETSGVYPSNDGNEMLLKERLATSASVGTVPLVFTANC